MRTRRPPKLHTSTEFDLDLAPLLSVMVKLVPVLLLSSAFVQVMMIETDLPQAVKEALAKQEDKPKATIQLAISKKTGVKIIISKNGQQTETNVGLTGTDFDFQGVHKALQEVKKQNPDVFSVEFAPDSNVAYKDIVKIMDEARRSRDKEIRFPLYDAKENKTVMTDYMFPDVVFTNMMDG